MGRWAMERQLINPKHIEQTEKFYSKYGGKTVVLARFLPIVRTFAPFVAGVGSMAYGQFAMYNVAGALLWAFLFVGTSMESFPCAWLYWCFAQIHSLSIFVTAVQHF